MLKVVLDTNLIISAFITPNGNASEVLKAWHDELFELIISPQIIEEMRRVLFLDKIKKYRFVTDEEANDFLSGLYHIKGFIEPKANLKIIKDDPDDDKFLIAGIAGKADYIVSGDNHLIGLGHYQDINIVSPKIFLEILYTHLKRK